MAHYRVRMLDAFDSADLKIIPDEMLTGDLGEGIVAQRARAMGFLWHPPGRIEGGLDGIIELRDPKTRGLTSDFIAAQSKAAVDKFDNDDGDTFTYTVDARDLAYWLKLPVPVILVVSRPSTDEAYYVPVKEYFAEEERRAKRRVLFDKKRDVFGDDPQALLDLARREANRRSLAADALLEGPMATLGLSDELEQAEQATAQATAKSTKARWRKAARLWGELADAIAATGVPRRLIWPALEERHRALREAGDKVEAARDRVALARDKIRLDEPTAWHDLAGLEWWVNLDVLGFELQLASAQANWAELGAEALDALRALLKDAKGAKDKREAAALLVEVLSIYGQYSDAFIVSDKERTTKVALGPRLSLELDWLDAAGELGHDVEAEWQELFVNKNLNRMSETRARVLQRRACYLTRRGRTDEAVVAFRKAAAVWRGVFGADDQVIEALNSALTAANLTGRPTSPLPFGAGAAAALARGSAQVPAVRAELLTLRGLNHLLAEHYADALRHLMAALALHHREGNLAAARNTRLFLGRAYAAADEPLAALGFYIRAGAPKQAAEIAARLAFAEAESVLRLSQAPPFELEASLAAAAHVRGGVDAAEARRVADDVLALAAAPPRIVAPDPHTPARRLVAQIAADLEPADVKRAVKILREDAKAGGPLQSPATVGLIRLSQKGVADSTKFFLERLLAGEDLPVTIAGYLRKTTKKTQGRVVEAAASGNLQALIEACRADLPDKWLELVPVLEARLEQELAEPVGEDAVSYLSDNVRGFGELARHACADLRRRFVAHLISIVLAAEQDELEKLAAIDAAAEVAPGLGEDNARRLWTLILPISEGHFPVSAPGLIASHANPKRARSKIIREVAAATFRTHALRAVARLAAQLPDTADELARTTASALASDEARLVSMALYVVRELGVAADPTRLEELSRHTDREVRELAATVPTGS